MLREFRRTFFVAFLTVTEDKRQQVPSIQFINPPLRCQLLRLVIFLRRLRSGLQRHPVVRSFLSFQLKKWLVAPHLQRYFYGPGSKSLLKFELWDSFLLDYVFSCRLDGVFIGHRNIGTHTQREAGLGKASWETKKGVTEKQPSSPLCRWQRFKSPCRSLSSPRQIFKVESFFYLSPCSPHPFGVRVAPLCELFFGGIRGKMIQIQLFGGFPFDKRSMCNLAMSENEAKPLYSHPSFGLIFLHMDYSYPQVSMIYSV